MGSAGLLGKRESLEEIATLAGHESLDTTRRYCEASHHDIEKAVNLIGEKGWRGLGRGERGCDSKMALGTGRCWRCYR